MINQPEALRLADELATRCVTRWVHSTGEMPRADGYAMDVECVKAAAELRRLHVEVERLREAAKQALERLALYYGGNGFAADAEVIKALHAALKETK